MKEKKKIDQYERKSIFAELKQYDYFAKEHDYMEITEWKNGEGFDVEILSNSHQRFQLTYGQYDALKSLIKLIYK